MVGIDFDTIDPCEMWVRFDLLLVFGFGQLVAQSIEPADLGFYFFLLKFLSFVFVMGLLDVSQLYTLEFWLGSSCDIQKHPYFLRLGT